MAQNSTSDGSANSKAEYLIINKSSPEKKLRAEDKYVFQENKYSFIRRNLKSYNNGNSVTNDLQEESSKNFRTALITENLQTDANTVIGSSSLMNPSEILDIIVEATYSIFFVKPIQMQIFHIPHAFRIPRQIKLMDLEGQFVIQLCERMEKVVRELTINNGKKFKGKKMIDNSKKYLDMEISPTPLPSLIEEEMLANNRRFILPLMEANKAIQIYEMHAESI